LFWQSLFEDRQMKEAPTPKPGDILEGIRSKKTGPGEAFVVGAKGNKIIVYYDGGQFAILKEELVSIGPGRWGVAPKKMD
jgi:hypothetical protein